MCYVDGEVNKKGNKMNNKMAVIKPIGGFVADYDALHGRKEQEHNIHKLGNRYNTLIHTEADLIELLLFNEVENIESMVKVCRDEALTGNRSLRHMDRLENAWRYLGTIMELAYKLTDEDLETIFYAGRVDTVNSRTIHVRWLDAKGRRI